jgi:taurine dioxygenase
MALEIRKLSHALGAEVVGADLGKLDDPTFQQIRSAFLDHCILLFRDQDLTREQFIAFSRRFGPLDMNEEREVETKTASHPELMLVVNRAKPSGAPATERLFGASWHTDNSHMPIAASATFLRAIELPEVGGDTMFANMYRAYDTLSDGMKKMIEPLQGVHAISKAVYDLSTPESAAESYRRFPAATHPAVRVHPESGRKALYVNGQIRLFKGMTAAESRPLVHYLTEHATDSTNVYRHRWHKNDLVMWDNRCVVHKALADYDRSQVRSMERTTVHGTKSGEHYMGPMD